MHVIVWSYRVVGGREAEFQALYAADGDWSRLFGRSPAYLGTQLLRDVAEASRFVTIDRWRTREDYQAFLESERPDYATLDARGDALTLEETRIGAFDA
jgi:heme-degrading monooxygenase HmoA